MNIRMTKPILKFSVLTICLTVIFLTILHFSIMSQNARIMFPSAIFFGVLMFLNGNFWGRREVNVKNGAMLGFAYHLATFILFNFMQAIWIFGFARENMDWFGYAVTGWFIGLLFHALLAKWLGGIEVEIRDVATTPEKL